MTDRPTSPRRPTPAAIKLAERYGITAEAMEDIISGTRAEYSPAQTSEPNPVLVMPPVHDSHTPAIEEAAIVAAVAAATAEQSPKMEPEAAVKPEALKPTSEKPRPVAGNPTAPINSREVIRTQTKTSSAGILTVIFTLLVIGIGLALSFQRGCFRQRRDVAAPTPVDTIQNMLSEEARKASTPPFTPTQTAPSQVPPESLGVPNGESPATPAVTTKAGAQPTASSHLNHSASHKHPSRATKPILETSSNLDAQEHLAELRANGDTKAKINAVRKHGTTVYRLERK